MMHSIRAGHTASIISCIRSRGQECINNSFISSRPSSISRYSTLVASHPNSHYFPSSPPLSRGLLKSARQALRGAHAGKLKHFKPTTPSLRHTVLVDRSHLWKGRPVHKLTKGLRKTGGRSRGRITVRHIGGGSKRLYRIIDFKRTIVDRPGIVERLEYDPNRSAFIALISYAHAIPTILRYIIAPEELQIGSTIITSRTKEVEIRPGNATIIRLMPVGTIMNCVEMRPGHGAQLARGAGTKCTLIDKNSRPGFGLIELQSKEQRYIDDRCLAVVGQVGNTVHHLRSLGKAGRSRNLGIRPTVRGVAMNPVDHPMGGGGGKAKGTHPKSPTGVLAKGFKTRHKRKPRDMIVVPRGGIKKGTKGGFAGTSNR